MIGKIPIKISGPVKHGDFIYASNKLPGVAVTEEQLCANKGSKCHQEINSALERLQTVALVLILFYILINSRLVKVIFQVTTTFFLTQVTGARNVY